MSNFRKDEMTVTFSSTIPALSVDTFSLSHYHIEYVCSICTYAKVTDFITFYTLVITDKV